MKDGLLPGVVSLGDSAQDAKEKEAGVSVSDKTRPPARSTEEGTIHFSHRTVIRPIVDD
jgi:hypothetical protein